MNAGQIIVITLIVGGIILWNWVDKGSKRDEAERKAKMEESEHKRREEERKRMAEREERMRKYRDEYDDYLKKLDNTAYPIGPRPLTFDVWREFHKKY